MASADANTPLTKPHISKNAPMYIATRSWITTQPAAMVSTVTIALSTISGIEMPSTPSA